MLARLAIYFVLGGAIIASITYFASVGRGLTAALVATVPSTSVITFIFIYLEAGNAGVISYARGLLYFLPAWLAYIVTIIFTINKLGIARSMALGFVAFLIIAFVARLIVKNWLV